MGLVRHMVLGSSEAPCVSVAVILPAELSFEGPLWQLLRTRSAVELS